MVKFILIAFLLTFSMIASATNSDVTRNRVTREDVALVNDAFASESAPAMEDDAWLLVISIERQCMVVCEGTTLRAVYTISSAKAGTGSKAGSERTPLGWHKVTEWIGGDAPLGQVFEARMPTSEVLPPSKWREPQSQDKVVSRIMWLSGLEPGKNRGGDVDSHARFIYLHGTNQEQLLGTPSSHGCIRMYNSDVAELFSRTNGSPTYCFITK